MLSSGQRPIPTSENALTDIPETGSITPLGIFFLIETGSHYVALDGLELNVQTKLASKSLASGVLGLKAWATIPSCLIKSLNPGKLTIKIVTMYKP